VRSLVRGRYGAAFSQEDALAPFVFNSSAHLSVDEDFQLIDRVAIRDVLADPERSRLRDFAPQLFSVSELVEPSYGELLVVWLPSPPPPKRTIPRSIRRFAEAIEHFLPNDWCLANDLAGEATPPPPRPLQLRLFSDVPIANFEGILPGKRLVFRPADALRLDLISLLSFASAVATQRYTDLRVDIIALVSIVAVTVRSILAYRNALTRYDLLVNRFITSKLTARGVGVVQYIAREAGIQRARRADYALRELERRSDGRRALLADAPAPSEQSGANTIMDMEVQGIESSPKLHKHSLDDLMRLGIVRKRPIDNSMDDSPEFEVSAPGDIDTAIDAHWRRLLMSKADVRRNSN